MSPNGYGNGRYTHTYIHTYIYVYTNIHIHTYICICVYACACIKPSFSATKISFKCCDSEPGRQRKKAQSIVLYPLLVLQCFPLVTFLHSSVRRANSQFMFLADAATFTGNGLARSWCQCHCCILCQCQLRWMHQVPSPLGAMPLEPPSGLSGRCAADLASPSAQVADKSERQGPCHSPNNHTAKMVIPLRHQNNSQTRP